MSLPPFYVPADASSTAAVLVEPTSEAAPIRSEASKQRIERLASLFRLEKVAPQAAAPEPGPAPSLNRAAR